MPVPHGGGAREDTLSSSPESNRSLQPTHVDLVEAGVDVQPSLPVNFVVEDLGHLAHQ